MGSALTPTSTPHRDPGPDCLQIVPPVLLEQVEAKVAMMEAAIQVLKPEHFNHAQWGGIFDAAYGFLRKTMRKDADGAADSLLLLALNKRVSLLEGAVVAATGRRALYPSSCRVQGECEGGATAAATPAPQAGDSTGSAAPTGVASGATQAGGLAGEDRRPDRCISLYPMFHPDALNRAQV